VIEARRKKLRSIRFPDSLGPLAYHELMKKAGNYDDTRFHGI